MVVCESRLLLMCFCTYCPGGEVPRLCAAGLRKADWPLSVRCTHVRFGRLKERVSVFLLCGIVLLLDVKARRCGALAAEALCLASVSCGSNPQVMTMVASP